MPALVAYPACFLRSLLFEVGIVSLHLCFFIGSLTEASLFLYPRPDRLFGKPPLAILSL
jgi:hypothetical protein